MTEGTLVVEDVAVETLVEDPHNARRHPNRSIESVVASLREFGQRSPLLVRGDVVLVGNARLRAMRELGWTMAQVSRVPETWSDAEARAFAIADNRTSDLATWDYEELVAGLTTVGDADLIRAAGYTPEEYDDLLARLQEGAVGPGGVRTTPSLEEYGERYADKATRLLVCEFRNATYIWLMEKLDGLITELEVNNNADVIIRLLAERSGETPP